MTDPTPAPQDLAAEIRATALTLELIKRYPCLKYGVSYPSSVPDNRASEDKYAASQLAPTIQSILDALIAPLVARLERAERALAKADELAEGVGYCDDRYLFLADAYRAARAATKETT